MIGKPGDTVAFSVMVGRTEIQVHCGELYVTLDIVAVDQSYTRVLLTWEEWRSMKNWVAETPDSP